jgi:uncharacterized protein (TIGR03067 family)
VFDIFLNVLHPAPEVKGVSVVCLDRCAPLWQDNGMKRTILASLAVAGLLASGCSTLPRTFATEFEGSWQGVELSSDEEGFVSMTIHGQTMEFHGEDDDDWVKGTFTLRKDTQPKQWVGIVTACNDAAYIGKTSYSIYKFENGALTLTGGDPGDAGPPPAFDAPGCREFVFQREK